MNLHLRILLSGKDGANIEHEAKAGAVKVQVCVEMT